MDINYATKLSKTTVLEKIEYVNEKRIRALLQSPYVDQLVKTKLRRLKKHRVEKNRYRVEYAYSNKYDINGRCWARGPSLQNFEARGNQYCQFLSGMYYHDIDQVNCMPTIIDHLFKQFSIDCPGINEYISNRSTILEEKNLTKQDVVTLLTYASRKIPDPFFAAIHATIYKNLIPHLIVEYKDIWTTVLAARDEKTLRNREGVFFCVVVQTVENTITTLIDQFFTNKGWSVDVLVFDGCIVRRRNGELITLDMLHECEQYIFERTGIDMKLAEKSPEVPPEFLERFHLQLESDKEDEEEDGEEPSRKRQKTDKKSRKEINFDTLKELQGWEAFDFRHLVDWTHVNCAEWFIEEGHGSVMHHSSGLIFVLGKDHIWRMFDTVKDSNLNIQISKSLIACYQKLLQDVEDDGDNQDDNLDILREFFRKFRRDIEMNSFSENVAKNISRLATQNDNCIDLFLSKPHLFAFTDGVYDLIRGEFRSMTAEDYILHNCGYEFPKQRHEKIRDDILKFYGEIFETEAVAQYRLHSIAQSVYGRILEEKFEILNGVGRNGKGSDDTLVSKAFGDYYIALDKRNFTLQNTTVDAANAQIFNCFGKRRLSVSESTVTDKFQSETFKRMSSNDIVSVRTLYGKPISFRVTGILNLQTNEEPKFDKMDFALVKRVRFLEYPFSFVDDPQDDDEGVKEKPLDPLLKTKFQSDEYRDEFIMLLIDVFRMSFVDPEGNLINTVLQAPEEVMQFTRKRLTKNLTVADWFNKYYEHTQDVKDMVEKPQIYKDYVDATFGTDTKPIGRNQFYKELDLLLKRHKLRGTWHYIRVKRVEEE